MTLVRLKNYFMDDLVVGGKNLQRNVMIYILGYVLALEVLIYEN